jgi:putative N-acetyltransferase (TIGR04045 family)
MTAVAERRRARGFTTRVVHGDEDPAGLRAFGALRRRAFVEEQGLFAADDADAFDGDPRTRTVLALDATGTIVGGVRLHPDGGDAALGWWRGSRLVCSTDAGLRRGLVGAALVGEACRQALDAGALRFDAHVQLRYASFFGKLGWEDVRALDVAGAPHRLMRWPVDRLAALAERTKAPLGELLGGVLATPPGWVGDDGVPVPGSDLVAAADAILPAMVERDPEWAGWCAMLVCAHDLAAMGALPVGALDTLGAPDAAHAARVLAGLRDGAAALRLPLLGGHTQLGVAPALGLCALGRAADPVPAGGGRVSDALSLTADLAGRWRPGYGRTQWDSSTTRSAPELAAMLDAVAIARPRAAKDVSMAGIAGTAGMLAEASGCGAVLDVARIPRPGGVDAADWLACFPGFAMLTADAPGAPALPAGPAAGAECGRLEAEPGVRLRWPDGDVTTAIPGRVTGLGPSSSEVPAWAK